MHKIRGRQKRATVEHLLEQDLVHRHEDVVLPSNNGEMSIDGLLTHPERQCHDCGLLTRDKDKIDRYCS